jgi:hypothetical protein
MTTAYRGLSKPLAFANTIEIVGLGTLIAFEPTTALLFGVAGLPLALALASAARRPAPLVVRGAAIAANALLWLACATFLVLGIVHFAEAGGTILKGVQFLLLVAPLFALYTLNIRALVGPDAPAPAQASDDP